MIAPRNRGGASIRSSAHRAPPGNSGAGLSGPASHSTPAPPGRRRPP
ncbi:hypothetical protein BZL30_0641 [Mycobacterium kansasii]|uniref:Uncharacterized protein n=1 Tax=Mycobacterium kansasii TaxID=1768 RepID=A0A1V3XRK3_MYCKA|nr:hypothetical protein BZL30_0641 [Mycobacterium kansasii]